MDASHSRGKQNARRKIALHLSQASFAAEKRVKSPFQHLKSSVGHPGTSQLQFAAHIPQRTAPEHAGQVRTSGIQGLVGPREGVKGVGFREKHHKELPCMLC